jgi:hypothetical protein
LFQTNDRLGNSFTKVEFGFGRDWKQELEVSFGSQSQSGTDWFRFGISVDKVQIPIFPFDPAILQQGFRFVSENSQDF